MLENSMEKSILKTDESSLKENLIAKSEAIKKRRNKELTENEMIEMYQRNIEEDMLMINVSSIKWRQKYSYSISNLKMYLWQKIKGFKYYEKNISLTLTKSRSWRQKRKGG